MMALINRPLTEAEVDKMLADYRESSPHVASLWDSLVRLTLEPTPHKVHYIASDGVRYVPPNEFWFDIRPDGPSDCVWIVPGT